MTGLEKRGVGFWWDVQSVFHNTESGETGLLFADGELVSLDVVSVAEAHRLAKKAAAYAKRLATAKQSAVHYAKHFVVQVAALFTAGLLLNLIL